MQNQTGGQIPQNQSNISSLAVSPQTNSTANYVDIIQQLEQAIGVDVQRLQMLMQQGVLSQTQGQYLMTQLAKKADEINRCKSAVSQMNYQPNAQNISSENSELNPFDLFNQENPGFFNGDGRADVLNYIRNYGMDKDEINQIAQLIVKLENAAVNSYLQKSAHEKSLNDENLAAKSKLTAYAQRPSNGSNYCRIFTREDIGNMSGEEFTKNENLIMDQVKQGLIK